MKPGWLWHAERTPKIETGFLKMGGLVSYEKGILNIFNWQPFLLIILNQ